MRLATSYCRLPDLTFHRHLPGLSHLGRSVPTEALEVLRRLRRNESSFRMSLVIRAGLMTLVTWQLIKEFVRPAPKRSFREMEKFSARSASPIRTHELRTVKILN